MNFDWMIIISAVGMFINMCNAENRAGCDFIRANWPQMPKFRSSFDS